jgi:hypothetical protein
MAMARGYRRVVPLRDAVILRAAAIWSVFTWVTFVRNIIADHTHHYSGAFKAIHGGVALVSVLFALGIWTVASTNRRRHPDERVRHGREDRDSDD